jgi:PAS domain S-box-containing protein
MMAERPTETTGQERETDSTSVDDIDESGPSSRYPSPGGRRPFLERALDELDDPFYVFDANGRLVRWNHVLTDLFDLTDEEIAGMAPTEFFLEADQPRIHRAVAETIEHGETVVEARAETTKGVVRFQLTGRRLVDDDGTVLGLCGVGRDVTEQRAFERRLAEQNERLEQFAQIVAHDLRNPLTVAKGFLDLERRDHDSERLARVEEALDRMDRIVDDVLAAARDGHSVIDFDEVPLDRIAQMAWRNVDTADATLDVRTTNVVAADEVRLRRLFENLFRNAVEHGGDSVAVSVTNTDEGFAVSDDGPGIPAEDRTQVFELGFSGPVEGTGLGLNIVRTLTEAHSWSVKAAEADSGGARFEFDTSGEGSTVVSE